MECKQNLPVECDPKIGPIARGNDYVFPLEFFDLNGVQLDLTGYEIHFRMRSSSQVSVNKQTNSLGIVFTDIVAGKADLIFYGFETELLELGNHRMEILIRDLSGIDTTVESGKVCVTGSIFEGF